MTALFLTFLSGGVGDYSMYLVQWDVQSQTGEPWQTEFKGKEVPTNAYGPLHAVLGWSYQFHWLLPKLLLSSAILGLFAVLCFFSLNQGQLSGSKLVLAAAVFPLCPLVVLSIYVQGMNDAFPALCIGLACLARHKRWFWLVGLLLGLGSLIKFYPLLFAPFFALDRDRGVRLSVLAVAAVTFLAGMAAAVGVWGEAVLSPFTFGVEREAKSLSFPQVLEMTVCAPGAGGLCAAIIDANMYFVLAVASVLAIYAALVGMNWKTAVALGIPLVFFSYKVGHNQFLVSWLAVLLFVVVQAGSEWRSQLLRAALPLVGFLCILKIGYILTGGLSGGGWDGDWSVVTFWAPAIWTVLLGLLLWSMRSEFAGRSWRFPRLAF